MAIENEQEVVDFLKDDKNKDFLEKNGFNTIKEIEKEKPMTAESVKFFLAGNKDLTKEIGQTYMKDYFKEKTGMEVTEDLLKDGVYFKKDIEELKRLTVKESLKNVKYADLVMSKIDFSKIKIEDGNLSGLNEQIAELQKVYKDLFTPTVPNTPPPLPNQGGSEADKIKAEIEELQKRRTTANRLRIMDLNRQLQEINKGE